MLHADSWRDNTELRIKWEAASGGTITLDESVRPRLWRARDAGHRELVQANDLSVVMSYLERLDVAAERREKFTVRYPDARFWTSASETGPLRYHGSIPAPVKRIESGPHRELGDLMDVMEALAARAREMRGGR